MYPFINSKIDNNKPILIIGNSPSVKNIELGKYINSSNFNIIRFNLAKIEGYEKYVGSDTTYGSYKTEDNILTIILKKQESYDYYGYSTILEYIHH